MRLVYKITLTFILPLVLTLGLWGLLSYHTMENKILADTDLILKDYSDNIIMRMLSGKELPERFNGAYNTYYIKEVSAEYAQENIAARYDEAETYLRNQEDFASSRVRKQCFMDNDGRYYEIGVSLPTFEQDMLVEHVLWWTILLFVVLLVSLLVISVLVLRYNMRPLDELLKWMDDYVPGMHGKPVPDDSDIREFRRLASAAQRAVDRFEQEYEERKIFIGNASHELQTPLAVCCNRLEMILDRPGIDEEMVMELVKLQRSLQSIVRLNKTLLLLSKIENGRFPEVEQIDFAAMLDDAVALYDEMYAHKDIVSSVSSEGPCVYMMNDQMASVLVNNLVKNAYVHSDSGARVEVCYGPEGFSVRNSGEYPLDRSALFRRFYQAGARKEGSTGLGLALAFSVCERNSLALSYDFSDSTHIFSVNLKKSK